jgi:hypothetical protein
MAASVPGGGVMADVVSDQSVRPALAYRLSIEELLTLERRGS